MDDRTEETMKHKRFQELLVLALYDELTDKEERTLNDHLQTCSSCRRQQEDMTKFHALLNYHKPAEVRQDQLLRARTGLQGALANTRHSTDSGGFFENLLGISPHGMRIAFSAALALSVGLLAGYALFGGQRAEPARPAPPEEKITNVRFLTPRSEDGHVEFFYESVSSGVAKGNINDPAIQKLLAEALMNEQNPGIRLRTVSTLASRAQKSGSADREIKAALILTIRTDRNQGVRLEALEALRQLPFDPQVKEALLDVLTHDKNPALRIAAIKSLQAAKSEPGAMDQDVMQAMKERVYTDNNSYIRFHAKTVLEELQNQ